MQDLSQQADRRVAQLGLSDSSDSDSDHDEVEPSAKTKPDTKVRQMVVVSKVFKIREGVNNYDYRPLSSVMAA